MTNYELADGSLSSEYTIGDTFTIALNGCKTDVVTCIGFDGEWCDISNFFTVTGIKWSALKPTIETINRIKEGSEND